MLVFCLAFVYITIYDFSEGRTLQAMNGSDVSFSFTFINKTTEDIVILHNKSVFISVWAAENFHIVHKEQQSTRVNIEMSKGETIIITIYLRNIKKQNAGIYEVAESMDSKQVTASILLQVIEGKTVRGVIGRNVSFSFTFSNITKTDAIFILHDTVLFFSIWPSENVQVTHKDKDKLRVFVDMSSGETITVTVSLLNLTGDDGGIYTVAHHLNSEQFNDGILLQTIDNAMIPRIDIDRYTVSDSSLVLRCFTSSSYAGILHWELNASLITQTDKYSHNNDYLSIRNLTDDDQYNSFTCLEQESGLESDPYRLKANGPGLVNFTPNKTVVMEYHSLNVSCISDCSPVCSYQWTKLERFTGLERAVSAETALYINNISRKDAGKYMCKVKNVISGTAHTNMIALDVVYGPDEIVMNASNAIIEMDAFHSITITCSADCSPPCQIHWSHSNNNMPGENLWLSNIHNDGNFTCHARNAQTINTSISKTIGIRVKSGTNTTTISNKIEDTAVTGTNTTTISNKMGDTGVPEGLDSTMTTLTFELRVNQLLMYLVVGMGVMLVTVFCICNLQKFVKRVPESIQFHDNREEHQLQGNPSEGYWTIVCNNDGVLNTELETNISQSIEPTPFANIQVTELNNMEIPQFQRTEYGMEFDAYIHAIHSDPENTSFMSTHDTEKV